MPNAHHEFGGEERFAVPPADVYRLLTDLDRLAENMPDVVSSERVDEHTVRATVRPGFAFLRGTLKLTVSLADLVPDQSAAMNVTAQGIGTTIRAESNVRLEPDSPGTRLVWTGKVVEMKGLVATVSAGLVQAAAEEVIAGTWKRFHDQLDGKAGGQA